MLIELIAFALVSSATLEEDFARQYDDGRGNVLASAKQIGRDIESGKIPKLVQDVANALVDKTVLTLSEKGFHKDAEGIRVEWEVKRQSFLVGRDVGDYEAITFLKNTHEKAHQLLGETLCRSTRIHDLFYFAYSLPMLLNCSHLGQKEISLEEYQKHVIPLMGIISYWAVLVPCIATVPVPFVCGLAANGVEQILLRFIAPKLSTKLYPRSCK